MGNDFQPLRALPDGPSLLQEELRQTFSEGIAGAVRDTAENLQFSRQVFQLPANYDLELKEIEQQLRALAQQIDGVVLAMKQSQAVHHLPVANPYRLAA